MNTKPYKTCYVPLCKNTSVNAHTKLFINLPSNEAVRRMWLTLANRDPESISKKSVVHFCEDHFDLPNDMQNYMEYHLMGTVSKISMKPGCMPTRFECQKRKQTCDAQDNSHILEKQKKIDEEGGVSEQSKRDVDVEMFTATEYSNPKQISPNTSGSLSMFHMDKSVQVNIRPTFRSKGIQTGIKQVHKMSSPINPTKQSASTSPFKISSRVATNLWLSSLNRTPPKFNIEEEQYDSDLSYKPSSSMQRPSSSDLSEMVEEEMKIKRMSIFQSTLEKIEKRTRFYIGVPKESYFLIDLIKKENTILRKNILLCLQKIRLNTLFVQLADDFGINISDASKIFTKTILTLASIMRPFIVEIDSEQIKKNLPIAFRHKYFNVSCIIDCLEIEIQKPTNSMNQASTWSEYKKANTIKYLVSCTPNGLVNYISPGYGGRISDTTLVESCDFVRGLQPGMRVMADRGFKHVENFLRMEGVQLVRPPSVSQGGKLTKSEVRETKQIAALRIHVERVIRRLREFAMLKPHACLNHNFIKSLDDIIVIACGLVNLQDSLIK